MKQYLALTLGAGAAATSAKGATVVDFYGATATLPVGLSITGAGYSNKGYIRSGTSNIRFAVGSSGDRLTDGSDLDINSAGIAITFFDDVFQEGASLGDQNYVNVTFDANDSVYEAVAQFHLEGPVASTSNYLIAIARNDDGSALSISDGKAAIDAASVSAVPEPASNLSLLALGAGGLLLRRRAKRAA